MLVAMLSAFVINVLLGVPLFICLLLAALAGFFFVDFGLVERMFPQRFFGGIDVFSLMAIPLFILAGNLMNTAGPNNEVDHTGQVNGGASAWRPWLCECGVQRLFCRC